MVLLGDLLAPYTLEEGRTHKRQKNLSTTSDAAPEAFLKTPNPMRHTFDMYLGILQCLDRLDVVKSDMDSKYKLPDTVVKTVQDYAQVAILAPHVKNYRNTKDGPKMEVAIATAMRTLGVSQVPPTFETGWCDVLHKVLGKACIDKRCHIKTEVFLSLANPTEHVDIATLARSCIGTSSAKPTAALYQRLALVCLVAVECIAASGTAAGKKADNVFWLSVDVKLALWRDNMSASEMQIMLEKTYKDDIEAYGAADHTIPVTLMRELDAWLRTINMPIHRPYHLLIPSTVMAIVPKESKALQALTEQWRAAEFKASHLQVHRARVQDTLPLLRFPPASPSREDYKVYLRLSPTSLSTSATCMDCP
ncbi:hypothetical protein C8R46DRAFT_1219580 [Mycena filopes]|nr:hypothetical protein C8R46DRAFT_1219580 [Mycena filopes]